MRRDRYSGRVPPVLSCSGVKRAYEGPAGRLEVLTGVCLSISAGEVAAILGPSGSGKSTLLRILAGLDSPDAGTVFWGDFPVHEFRPQQLAARRSQNVGLIFQQHHLLEDLTAEENVSLPGRIRGRPDRERALELLQLVGLAERAAYRPAQLSGGERQRVAVARALYDEPPLILADEPTGSLDRRNAAAVYALLVGLARERGSAVLMVTHDEGLVSDVDRRFTLTDGLLEGVPAHA